jgi:hypothetical protein
MSELPGYQSTEQREKEENPKECMRLVLTPWSVQNIAYELVKLHFLTNDPKEQGFRFNHKFSEDPKQSEIHLDLGFNFDSAAVNKRPAVFVLRRPVQTSPVVMNQTIGYRAWNSEKQKHVLNYMGLDILCVATNVGFAEELARFVRNPFIHYQEQIQQEFGFRRFRLAQMGAPQYAKESKEHFIVPLTLETVFDENWVVRGDNLKIKSIPMKIFTSVLEAPLDNQ